MQWQRLSQLSASYRQAAIRLMICCDARLKCPRPSEPKALLLAVWSKSMKRGMLG